MNKLIFKAKYTMFHVAKNAKGLSGFLKEDGGIKISIVIRVIVIIVIVALLVLMFRDQIAARIHKLFLSDHDCFEHMESFLYP